MRHNFSQKLNSFSMEHSVKCPTPAQVLGFVLSKAKGRSKTPFEYSPLAARQANIPFPLENEQCRNRHLFGQFSLLKSSLIAAEEKAITEYSWRFAINSSNRNNKHSGPRRGHAGDSELEMGAGCHPPVNRPVIVIRSNEPRNESARALF